MSEVMPLQQAQKEQTAPIQVTKEEREEKAWKITNEFHDKAKVQSAEGAEYAYLNELDMAGLREEMKKDTRGKSESFTKMYDAVNNLLNLSETKGKYKAPGSDEEMTADFFSTMFEAKQNVNNYIFSHSGNRHSPKGRQRMQISLRLQTLLKNLEKQVAEKQKELPKEKAEIVELRSQGYTDEEIEKIRRERENEKLAEEIRLKLKAAELAKKLKNRDDLLARAADEENRQNANLVRLAMSMEKEKKTTMRLPALRQEVSDYIIQHAKPKEFLLKPDEFQDIIDTLTNRFAEENAERLEMIRARRDRVLSEFGLEEDAPGLWENPRMEKLLLDGTKELFSEEQKKKEPQEQQAEREKLDASFEDGIKELKDHAKVLDEVMNLALEKQISVMNRGKAKESLKKFVGAAGILGTEQEMLDLAGTFVDMYRYIEPEAGYMERKLDRAMAKLLIPQTMRDHFIETISNGNMESLEGKSIGDIVKLGKQYSKRMAGNLHKLVKVVDEPLLTMTESQWKDLEAMMKVCGAIPQREIDQKIKELKERDAAGEKKISRREYAEVRKMQDAEYFEKIKKQKEEDQKALESYREKNDIMQMRFLSQLASGEGGDMRLPFVRTSAMLLNLDQGYETQTAGYQNRLNDRLGPLMERLEALGFNDEQCALYAKRLEPMMMVMRETKEDDPDYKRLEAERLNMERFGIARWEDALDLLDQYGGDLAQNKENRKLLGAAELLRERKKLFAQYAGGRYKMAVDFLMNIPEVYMAMMSGDEQSFLDFLGKTVDPKLSALAAGIEDSGEIGSIFKQEYLFLNLQDVYDGKITGSAEYFAKAITDYQVRITTAKTADGGSIEASLQYAMEQVAKEAEKQKLSSSMQQQHNVIATDVFTKLFDDPNAFELLYNKKKLYEHVKESIENRKGKIEEDSKKKMLFYVNVDTQLRKEDGSIWEWTEVQSKKVDQKTLDEMKKKNMDSADRIAAQEEAGRLMRQDYLAINREQINRVRAGKSLIRVDVRGDELVDLDMDTVKNLRGRIEKKFGAIELPQALMDAIIEFGSVASVDGGRKAYDEDDDRLKRHLYSMAKLYDGLTHSYDEKEVMTPDEAQLFLLQQFSTERSRRQLFQEAVDVAWLRKTAVFSVFRQQYKMLREVEEMELDDPHLEGERLNMSKDIRAMLITRVGLMDKDGKTIDFKKVKDGDERLEYEKRMFRVIEKHKKYLKQSAKLNRAIRNILDTDERYKDYTETNKDRMALGLRIYKQDALISELNAGEYSTEKEWEDIVRNNLKEEDKLSEYCVNKKDSITNVEHTRVSQKTVDGAYGPEMLSELIDDGTTLFKGRRNRYNRLDEDQKKFFAVALMLMDKGSVGLGTEGTAGALAAPDLKAKQVADIQEQLENYIAGGSFDIKIDYREAVFKLFNYGKNAVNIKGYSLSKTAYDKAYRFAQSMLARRKVYGEKDVERMNDAKSSIRSAALVLGKQKQQNEVDKLAGITLTLKDVQNKMAEYAVLDKRDSMVERIRSMNERDLRLFVRLMQERMVLDRSTIDTSDEEFYADQQKRNAMMEGLTGEKNLRNSIINGYDDDEACHKALFTALSFQLRDDMNFAGKELTKDHYARRSARRRSLVDWRLVRHCFGFMDEIKKKQTEIYAVRNAKSYIKQSGNQKAIAAYDQLQRDIPQRNYARPQDFDKFLRTQAKDDRNDEIRSAVAGYNMLSDAQKRLFVKVLGRRDLLDISKKKMGRNFLGKAEREYVNKAGRFALIDEYIKNSIGGNEGVQLEDGAYFDAMETLLSTQVSDRVDFTKEDQIQGGITGNFAWERQLVRGRTTAVDWKLFRRALNFVNRASEELEYTEGNAELYRAAGQMSRFGSFSMRYDFLRKNFHNTGNHIGRFAARMFGAHAKSKLKLEETVGDVMNTVTGISDGLRGDEHSTSKVGRFVRSVDRVGKKVQKELKNTYVNPSVHKITKMGVQEAKKDTKAVEKNYYEKMKDDIDKIIANSKSVKNSAVELGQYIQKNFINKSEALKFAWQVDGKDSKINANNTVEKIVNTKKANESDADYQARVRAQMKADAQGLGGDSKHPVNLERGDFRDTIIAANTTYNTVNGISGIIFSIGGISYDEKKQKNLSDLISYATEKLVLQTVNENLMHKTIDLSPVKKDDGTEQKPSELPLLEKAAKEYIGDMYKQMVGEDRANKVLAEMEEKAKFAETVGKQVKSAMSFIKYGQKCVAHVENIVQSVENLRVLEEARKVARAQRAKDKETLENAKDRQDEDQQKITQNIRSKHVNMSTLGKELSMTVQGFNIAEDVINATVETVETFGGKANVGQDMMVEALQMGFEFVLYLFRCSMDNDTLRDYYMKTNRGKAVLNKIEKSYDDLGEADLKEKLRDENNTLNMVSDCLGYESVDELRRNTGMSIAQSIVFCASDYNPLMETKLMAITVMSVLGMKSDIGKIDPQTVEKLFTNFKMG